MSLFFYLFTFAINLWLWKFVTADVTAVFVNDQHGIQRRVQNFNKKHINIRSYTCRGIKMAHLKCNLLACSSISSIIAEYLQKF